MTKIKAKKQKILISSGVLFLPILALLILLNSVFTDQNAYNIIFIISWLGNITFISCLFLYIKINDKILSPYIVFLFAFFAFQFGQFVVYSFNVPYNYFFKNVFYLTTFHNDLKLLINSQIIFIVGMWLFNFGASIIAYQHIDSVKKNVIHSSERHVVDDKAFINTGKFFFFISVIPAFYLKISQLFIALTNGYIGIYHSEMSKFFIVIEIFFIPSLLMLLLSEKNRIRKMIIIALIVFYACINFLIGGRTDAMSIIAVIVVFYFINRKKKIKFSTILSLGVIGYFGMCLAVSVAEFRGYNNKTIFDLIPLFVNKLFSFDVVFSFLGELGWSGITLPATMYHLNGNYGYGITYLSSILGLIPKSFDFLGIVSSLESYSVLDVWLTKCMNLSFGSGYSLSAEAFYNFGYLSPLFMFALGCLIGKILYLDFDHLKSLSSFTIYAKFVMLYSLITLPRRMSIHLIDSVFYYIIVVFIVYVLAKQQSKALAGSIKKNR